MPNESSAVYPEATPQPRVSILLVEDEETLRIAVAKMLGKRGFCVMEAADGLAALQILRDHPGQLEAMLLDVSLPGVSSSVVLREAKRLQPGLRVVLTSAHSEQMVAEMFAGMPIETFIRKPYRLDDVMQLMRRQ